MNGIATDKPSLTGWSKTSWIIQISVSVASEAINRNDKMISI